MKTCACPFFPFGIMYEGVGDLASQSSPVNKVWSLVSAFFAFHYEAQGGLKVTFATTCTPQPTTWGTHMLS